jgi:hypothetical protein
VPKIDVAKVGQWVDDYIRHILMWNGEQFTINYDVVK